MGLILSFLIGTFIAEILLFIDLYKSTKKSSLHFHGRGSRAIGDWNKHSLKDNFRYMLQENEEDVSGRVIVGIMVGVLVMAIFMLITTGKYRGPFVVITTSQPLQAVYTDTRLQGSFVFLSGSVEEADKIYYWVKMPDGGARRESMPFNSSIPIYEENRVDGELRITSYKCKFTGWENFKRILGCYGIQEYQESSFHVPKGSVFAEYKIK